MRRAILTICLATALNAIGAAQVPAASHVFVVTGVRHSYGGVIGGTSMPYLNSLANKYGLATQYYADVQPSIGDYFMMTTGQTVTTSTSYTGPLTADSIVQRLMLAGKTWKSYAEDLPSVGYVGGNINGYVKYRNPFAYFSDVAKSSSEALNLVPFTQFATDLANDQLPNYSFIIPNLCHSGNTCSLATMDQWLQTHIAPLLASPTFQNGGLLILTFDESISTDLTDGGGHVATVVIGPKVKSGYRSSNLYRHENLLRLTMEALGMTTFPGAAATANDMSEFFTASTTDAPPVAVLLVSPTSGTAPLAVTADSSKSYDSGGTIASRSIDFGDGAVVTTTTASHTYSVAGTYRVTLKVTDNAGLTSTTTTTVTAISSPTTLPTARLTPASLSFALQTVGTTSAAQTIVLTNTSTLTLNIGSISTSGNFSVASNSCAASLAAGASCNIGISFSPTTSGTLIGTLSVSDNASGSPQTAVLSGTGAITSPPTTSIRYYGDTSFFNQPIPSNPAIDPNSAGMVSNALVAYQSSAHLSNTDAWGPSVAFATSTSKVYAVRCSLYCSGTVSFPIPAGAQPSTGSDHHLMVIYGTQELDMWEAVYDSTNDAWSAGNVVINDLYGWGASCPLGQHCNGPYAAGFSGLGGIIRPEEIKAGHIDHALQLVTPNTRAGYIACPATHTDGKFSTLNALPEGAHVQLDPSFNVDAQPWPTWEKIIAKALQQYGAYVADTGGSLTIRGEGELNLGTDTWASASTPLGGSLSNLPWNLMRVLQLQSCN